MADVIAPRRPCSKNLKPLDVAGRDAARIAPLQLPLGLQFVQGLLVRARGLLKLPVGLHDIDPRQHELRLDLRDLATRGLRRGLLLRTVQPEDRLSLGDRTVEADIHLGDASVGLRNDRNRPEEQRDVGRGRMVVEDHRDQAHSENQAGGDSPPQLEPHGENGYFLADPLVLDIPAEEIVRDNCQQGAEKNLKHGSDPCA